MPDGSDSHDSSGVRRCQQVGNSHRRHSRSRSVDFGQRRARRQRVELHRGARGGPALVVHDPHGAGGDGGVVDLGHPHQRPARRVLGSAAGDAGGRRRRGRRPSASHI